MNTIITPTVKTPEEIAPLHEELRRKAHMEAQWIVSCDADRRGCAWAMNQALSRAEGEYILKVDDDVYDFPDGWDEILVSVLRDNPDIAVVAPRLMFPNGDLQMTCSHELNLEGPMTDSPRKVVPFCCAAWRNDGTRFDEGYIGTWCDDSDFCAQLRMKSATARFVTLNTMRIKHRNEGKGRHAVENGARFGQKWGSVIFPDGKGLL